MKIFCGWELGEDLGHLTQLNALANALARSNHTLTMVLKDLSKINHLPWEKSIKFIQAPVWPTPPPPSQPAACFSDFLINKGYSNPNLLSSMILAWRNLIEFIDPHLVVVDYAPTCQIALRDMNIPCYSISTGLLSPPPQTDDINLRPWEMNSNQDQHIFSRQQELQLHIESAHRLLGNKTQSKLRYTGDCFTSHKSFILGPPLLDPYKQFRKNAVYVQHSTSASTAFNSPNWNDPYSHQTFAYLKRNHIQSLLIISALKKIKSNAICFLSGASDYECKSLSTRHVQVTASPLNTNQAISSKRSVICHGGIGIISQALLNGCSLLIAPTQVEQAFNAHTLKTHQLTHVFSKFVSPNEAENLLTSFYEDHRLKENAVDFSNNHINSLISLEEVAALISKSS